MRMRLVECRRPRVESGAIAGCGLRIADYARSVRSSKSSRASLLAPRPSSGPRLSTLDPRPMCRGFTLVELLVAITIIGILAALVLGVAAVAGETAREQHTRHVVERLHTLLTDFYGTFKTRRVRLNPAVESIVETEAKNNNWNGARKGQTLAEARLYAMREMMLMEIPDRWSDIVLDPVTLSVSATPIKPIYLPGRTELSNIYFRRFMQLIGRKNVISEQPNTVEEIQQNQGAECLYMIITIACGDGEARTLFGESTIGDTDGDGAPEFLDGWGHPIGFLRWAPGFDSQIQSNANLLDAGGTAAWKSAASGDHDPNDLFRVDATAFRLVPLIYSGGRDENDGIYTEPTYVAWQPASFNTMSFANKPPYIGKPVLTPYVKGQTGFPDYYLGTSLHDIDQANYEATATDNVHNHLLGKR